jgi:uncharacterized membrane protein YphA (DoxX/SURF4 family)
MECYCNGKNPFKRPCTRALWPQHAPSLTIFFTILETLGAIVLILGLLTRLAAVRGVIEFAITGSMGVTKDFGLFAGALVLFFYGSFLLSADGLIAKKKKV